MSPKQHPLRVLLASTAERGHFNPLVAPAQHLRRAGHTVGWLVLPHADASLVDPVGAELVTCPDLPPPPSLTTGGKALAELVRDAPALRAWIKTLLLDAVPAQIAPVRRALRAWSPDVLVADPMLYQVALAAHDLHLPWLGASSSLNPVVPEHLDAELVRTLHALDPDRRALFARHGLPHARFAVADHLSPWGTTVFSAPGYGDVFGPPPPGVTLVGPSIPLGPRGDEPLLDLPPQPHDRPIVYASFGSQIAWQPRRFDLLAQATGMLGVSLIASVGDLYETPWARRLPAHVTALRYAPQRAILEHAAVMVTHGGANSVMEALTAGVPLLIAPVCNDQPLQARFVTAARVGLHLDLDQTDVETVTASLAALLTGEATPGLPTVTAAYRALDGGARVAAMAAALVNPVG